MYLKASQDDGYVENQEGSIEVADKEIDDKPWKYLMERVREIDIKICLSYTILLHKCSSIDNRYDAQARCKVLFDRYSRIAWQLLLCHCLTSFKLIVSLHIVEFCVTRKAVFAVIQF